MNSNKAIIGKNLVLISLVALTFASLFNGLLEKTTLLVAQAGLGLVYAFLSYHQYNNTNYKAQLPIERFSYFPGSFLALRAVKVGLYLTFALVLFFSPSLVMILYPVCLIIAITEMIITALKYVKKLCFINLYANYIFIALEDAEKIFANEINYVEYRHGIFFFIKNNNKSVTIKTFALDNKEEFMVKMKNWLKTNNIKISEEPSVLLNK